MDFSNILFLEWIKARKLKALISEIEEHKRVSLHFHWNGFFMHDKLVMFEINYVAQRKHGVSPFIASGSCTHVVIGVLKTPFDHNNASLVFVTKKVCKI